MTSVGLMVEKSSGLSKYVWAATTETATSEVATRIRQVILCERVALGTRRTRSQTRSPAIGTAIVEVCTFAETARAAARVKRRSQAARDHAPASRLTM